MLNVAHVRFRPYPEMFGGILGSLDSVLPPGFFPSFVKFRQNLNLNLVRFELTSHWSAWCRRRKDHSHALALS